MPQTVAFISLTEMKHPFSAAAHSRNSSNMLETQKNTIKKRGGGGIDGVNISFSSVRLIPVTVILMGQKI